MARSSPSSSSPRSRGEEGPQGQQRMEKGNLSFHQLSSVSECSRVVWDEATCKQVTARTVIDTYTSYVNMIKEKHACDQVISSCVYFLHHQAFFLFEIVILLHAGRIEVPCAATGTVLFCCCCSCELMK